MINGTQGTHPSFSRQDLLLALAFSPLWSQSACFRPAPHLPSLRALRIFHLRIFSSIGFLPHTNPPPPPRHVGPYSPRRFTPLLSPRGKTPVKEVTIQPQKIVDVPIFERRRSRSFSVGKRISPLPFCGTIPSVSLSARASIHGKM